MPEAADLRVLRSDRVTWIFAGKTALFRFADTDTAMRNIAVGALRQIGFSGTQVAAALGLTTNYVATLHQRAQREGTAGLVRPRGRPRTVTETDWERARAWRAAGVRDAEIARRLGVQQSTVLRRPGPGARRAGAGGCPRRAWTRGRAGTGGRAAARRAGARAARARAAARTRCRAAGVRGDGGGSGRQAGVLPVCGGDAAARLSRAGRGDLAGRGGRRRPGGGAAVGGEHGLRAGGGHGRAGQAPGPGRGRAAGRA